MSDKEKIKEMDQVEAENKLIEILNENEKARYFSAGVAAALRNLSIRPVEFADGCRENA